MLKGGIIGLGKMGISHAAIIGAHKDVEMTAVCDTSSLVLSGFKRYTSSQTYSDFEKMLEQEQLDLVIVATPTKLHYSMVRKALNLNVHVFCEKPFSLDPNEGAELVELAAQQNLVNQVGYHNHFIGTFKELKKLLSLGILGELTHFSGEAYGPVVTKEKVKTWRSNRSEGGGCLYDYASHVLNLVQEVLGRPQKVHGALVKSIYSRDVDDAVYALLSLTNGLSGSILVNWSDDTYRKMSTSLMVQGKNGKIICDATEIKIYLKEPKPLEGLETGWTIKYITDLAIPVSYYLRGEEYSAQIDHFVGHIKSKTQNTTNTFEQGLYTDQVIAQILKSNTNA